MVEEEEEEAEEEMERRSSAVLSITTLPHLHTTYRELAVHHIHPVLL